MSHDRDQRQRDDPSAQREEVLSTAGGLVATAFGLTDIGCQRQVNQDTLGNRSGQYATQAQTHGLLYAIADGMGGHARGEVASALAIEHLFAAYYRADLPEPPPQRLEHAIAEANGAVYAAGRAANRGTMGTTLTLVLLHNNTLYVGNIGDSRTYRIRAGRIEQLSQDHSLIGEQIRSGVLTEEQARHSTIRNVITRAVGYREHVAADIFTYPVAAGDVLLLCSDGLHGLVENQELVQICSGHSLQEAVAALIALARDRGGPDNITALMVRIDQAGESVTVAPHSTVSEAVTAPLPTIPPRLTVETVEPPPTETPAANEPTQEAPLDLNEAATKPIRTIGPADSAAPTTFPGLPGPPASTATILPPGPSRPAQRRPFPVLLLVVLPLVLIGMIGAGGIIALGARDRRGGPTTAAVAANSVTTPTIAPSAASATPGAAASITTTVTPTLLPAIPTPVLTTPAAPAPSSALPPAQPAPTPTVTGSKSEPSIGTGVGGTVTFTTAAGVPDGFPKDWEVVAFPRDTFGNIPDFTKMLTEVPSDRAALTSTGTADGSFQYELQIKLPPDKQERDYLLVIRQGNAKVLIPRDATVKVRSGQYASKNLEIIRIEGRQ